MSDPFDPQGNRKANHARGEIENALFKVRMHTLDSDHPARLALNGLVHLGQARDADRVRVERREEVGHRGAGLGEEERLQFVERGREALVLEGAHRFGPRGGDQLDRREVLAELVRVRSCEKRSVTVATGNRLRSFVLARAHLDVDPSELPERLHQAVRGLPVRVLIVLMALRVPLGRLGPLLPEQQLVIDDGAQDRPADDGAAFDGDDAVSERGRELVRGRKGGEGQGEEQESALAPRRAVFVVPGPDGLEGQFSREEEVQVVLELAQAVP